MKICFPVEHNKGLESAVFGHFGSAPIFMVYDTESATLNPLENQDLDHIHGKCSPIKALGGSMVDVVVVGGIGAGAINKLNSMGIKVYRASQGSIEENIDLFDRNVLSEIAVEHACGGHAGGCAH